MQGFYFLLFTFSLNIIKNFLFLKEIDLLTKKYIKIIRGIINIIILFNSKNYIFI